MYIMTQVDREFLKVLKTSKNIFFQTFCQGCIRRPNKDKRSERCVHCQSADQEQQLPER